MSRNLDIESYQFRERLKKEKKEKKKKEVTLKSIKCPKCDIAFDDIAIGSENIAHCNTCNGIWLQKGQLEELCSINNCLSYLNEIDKTKKTRFMKINLIEIKTKKRRAQKNYTHTKPDIQI